ncbi:hypothetical protein AAFF_G00053010 [Aldrovandia affinis]|uniref:Uncharacterized protein n=1 Tax=Aldrovandia affinis TaxID=143900 RepID=A0AAD7WYI6_9TELE|nr:hypothetical protein AAFF_G00053010 [Aldrovandia affinis]
MSMITALQKINCGYVFLLAETRACFPKQDPERGGGHMISTDEAEYPREYRTLGNGTRRFSNVGLVHTSERRHTVIAAQSLDALASLQTLDAEHKRDAFMDHLRSKYPAQHLPSPSPSPSHGSMRGTPDRAREQSVTFTLTPGRDPGPPTIHQILQ